MATKVVDPLKSLVDRWAKSVCALARKRGQVSVVIGDYGEAEWVSHVYAEEEKDENDIELRKDPQKKARLMQRLTDFLNSLPIVFISETAKQNMERLIEALDMVGRDHWTDRIARPQIKDCLDFQIIIEAELQFCADLMKKKRYGLAIDALIGTVLALRHNAYGFYHRDNDPQPLLDQLGGLWQRLMGGNLVKKTNQKRTTLPSGYIRESAAEMKLQIPEQITLMVQKWMGPVLNVHTKRVLYIIMQDLSDEMRRSRLDEIPFGVFPSDIINVRHEKVVMLKDPRFKDESTSTKTTNWTEEDLESKTIEELRAICRNEEQCAINIESTNRQDLIEYILYPKYVVSNMKRKRHYQMHCLPLDEVFPPSSFPERALKLAMVRHIQFDDRKYLVRDGTVLLRRAYDYESQGVEMPVDRTKKKRRRDDEDDTQNSDRAAKRRRTGAPTHRI